LEGTKILCFDRDLIKEEYVPIERLRAGHLVKTLLHGYVSINMIGKSMIENPGNRERILKRLYKCSPNNYPELFEDLILTGCHSILVEEMTEEQKEKSIEISTNVFITDDKYRLMACTDDNAEPYDQEGKFPIWHIALDNEDYIMNYGVYANGVKMTISTELPNGIKFIGTEGWIFVTRGNYKASANEPAVPNQKALSASNPKIIESVIGANEINLYRSEEHHGNWLESMRTRMQPIAPVEVGHRSCSTCLIHHLAIKLDRKLFWDPLNERFKNDDEANGLLNRQHRFPYLVKGLA
jgi:hypothetical protein